MDTVDGDTLRALLEAGRITLIEALPVDHCNADHLPGARNVPSDLTADLAAQLAPDRAGTIVVYCSGPGCQRSKLTAAAFTRLGYTGVLVYPGGKSDWAAAGLPFHGSRVTATDPIPFALTHLTGDASFSPHTSNPRATPVHIGPPTVDNAPPIQSKVAGGLAALACAACCAIPLLIVTGVLTGASAALFQQTLIAVAAGLAVLALGMWWLHRRRAHAEATSGTACGCDGDSCAC